MELPTVYLKQELNIWSFNFGKHTGNISRIINQLFIAITEPHDYTMER